tara:strand:- start:1089 stop:1673 length:585 start_codon:yes stop_codon:yes gene_type:complete
MSFYFKHFPFVKYDISGDNTLQLVQNPLIRFKIKDTIDKFAWAGFLEYVIQEEETASEIAYRIYEDETLDWVIYITNNIIDIKYDWPLGYNQLNNYIIAKYGSVENASDTTTTDNIHHYEWIIQQRQTRFDGTVLPEKVLIVDEAKYLSLIASERRIVRNHEYELNLNEEKRNIKLLKEEYVLQFLSEIKSVLV